MDHRTLSGKWRNELGSIVQFEAHEDMTLTGLYFTKVGNATEAMPLCGYFVKPTETNLLVVFSVAWRKVLPGKKPSTTAWNGTLFIAEDGAIRLQTAWHLVRSTDEGSIWDATLTNTDQFVKLADLSPADIHEEDGVLHQKYEILESTMERAVECKTANPDVPCVVVSASQQSSGRGSKNSVWLSPKGNVYVTIAIDKDLSGLESNNFVPMATALAVYQTIKALATSHNAQLPSVCVKWPNDVVAPVITDAGRTSTNLCAYMPDTTVDETITSLVHHLKATLKMQGAQLIPLIRDAMDWQLEMRSKTTDRQLVRPVRLNADGSLVARWVETGDEKTVAAEYFW